MKQSLDITKNRREFLKDGLRAVLFGGLALSGLFLGWRGYSGADKESSCLIDLPCRSCSKLSGCQEPRAINARQEPDDSRFQSTKMNKGIRNDR
jgi:hypothetical protein